MRAVQRDIGDVMTRLGKNSTCKSLLGLISIILHLTVEGWADSVSDGGKGVGWGGARCVEVGKEANIIVTVCGRWWWRGRVGGGGEAHTPSTAFRHLQGCRKPLLGVWERLYNYNNPLLTNGPVPNKPRGFCGRCAPCLFCKVCGGGGRG